MSGSKLHRAVGFAAAMQITFRKQSQNDSEHQRSSNLIEVSEKPAICSMTHAPTLSEWQGNFEGRLYVLSCTFCLPPVGGQNTCLFLINMLVFCF